ncbi:hypothetical protein [uncultured Pseudoteredinibacter sp.]|uniref:hypothetical protein n=1 Tax=uncultured Pseudoteredinibacter sp. TaxID=1641701 RepID=UPI002627E86C|nr:hypothetical protein [uncultured Pseudoteredinibacter sp.]
MSKILVLVGLLLSFSGNASHPANPINITPDNISDLGFKIETQKIGEQNYVRLVAPLKIDHHWVPVTTQAYVYTGEENGALNEVELGSLTKEISINSYYKPSKQDLMVGIYYLCGLNRHSCKGDWDSRLYLIQSVNQYSHNKQLQGDAIKWRDCFGRQAARKSRYVMEENNWLKKNILLEIEFDNPDYSGVPLKEWGDLLTLSSGEFLSRGVGLAYMTPMPAKPKPNDEKSEMESDVNEALTLWKSVAREFYKLLCTKDRKYTKLRKKLNTSANEGSKILIGAVAAAFAAEIGVAGAAIMAFCTSLVYAAIKLGIEGYCAIALYK